MTFLSLFESGSRLGRRGGGSAPHGPLEPQRHDRGPPAAARGRSGVAESRNGEGRGGSERAVEVGAERGLRGWVLARARETSFAPRAARDRRLRGDPGRGQQKTR